MEMMKEPNNTIYPRHLHKFGGRTLSNIDEFKQVAKIIQQETQPQDIIVIAAMGNTTNLLLDWVALSSQNPVAAHELLQHIKSLYTEQASILLKDSSSFQETFLKEIRTLTTLVDQELDEATHAHIISYGEIWTVRLLSYYLAELNIENNQLDAREFLFAERAVLPIIDEKKSAKYLTKILKEKPLQRILIPGFISRNEAGETVLLGRSGSDYSATSIATLIGIENVTIWGHFDGVYSADPQLVKDAIQIPFLRVDEADELARLFAPILHPRTLSPVKQHQLSLLLRSSQHPDQGSTRIEHLLASNDEGKIVTHNNSIGIISLKLPMEFALNDKYKEIIHWLNKYSIQPLASQFKTENYCLELAYPNSVINKVFNHIQTIPFDIKGITIEHDFSLISVVGSGVTHNTLQLVRFWQQLKNQPVEFIWQSPDELSCVAVLRQSVTPKLLINIHNELFRAHKSIGIVMLGKGDIATKWLDLFYKEQANLSARSKFDFKLIGTVTSQAAWLDYRGLPYQSITQFNQDFSTHAHSLKPQELLTWMRNHSFDELIILDLTASDIVAKHYLSYAKHGFHIISANKRAAAFPLQQYQELQEAFLQTNSHWLFNAAVGGGLPINNILRNQVESGDTILSIEGTFSATMDWIFFQYNGENSISELIEQAWQQGVSERDPREDLSGQDALRKLLIAARSSGYQIDIDKIKVRSIIPQELLTCSLDEFFDRLHEIEEPLHNLFLDAKESHQVLRYVARFDANKRSTISLEKIDYDDPLAQTIPGEGLYLVHSMWFRDRPLQLKGPSSGPAMTAGAIQNDLNTLLKLL